MRLPSRLIVVRRGESDTFKMILNSPDRWPATTAVMFDRRERERRVLELQVTLERDSTSGESNRKPCGHDQSITPARASRLE